MSPRTLHAHRQIGLSAPERKVHDVGSTAIPGIAAQPILDVRVLARFGFRVQFVPSCVT